MAEFVLLVKRGLTIDHCSAWTTISCYCLHDHCCTHVTLSQATKLFRHDKSQKTKRSQGIHALPWKCISIIAYCLNIYWNTFSWHITKMSHLMWWLGVFGIEVRDWSFFLSSLRSPENHVTPLNPPLPHPSDTWKLLLKASRVMWLHCVLSSSVPSLKRGGGALNLLFTFSHRRTSWIQYTLNLYRLSFCCWRVINHLITCLSYRSYLIFHQGMHHWLVWP